MLQALGSDHAFGQMRFSQRLYLPCVSRSTTWRLEKDTKGRVAKNAGMAHLKAVGSYVQKKVAGAAYAVCGGASEGANPSERVGFPGRLQRCRSAQGSRGLASC